MMDERQRNFYRREQTFYLQSQASKSTSLSTQIVRLLAIALVLGTFYIFFGRQ